MAPLNNYILIHVSLHLLKTNFEIFISDSFQDYRNFKLQRLNKNALIPAFSQVKNFHKPLN